ncbi:MAG TPA: ABC transporter substrate-binding protein [Chitinophagales bacterium]|nr:ABC transporter substrate-binding protein [Chitinophagales bacterium]
MKYIFLSLFLIFVLSCKTSEKKSNAPVIGFMDAFKDETLEQANNGFFDALKQNGFSKDSSTLTVIYRNAQNDIPTLTQIADYFISQKVNLIATNPSLSTITACQKTKTIPVCMMVSPSPKNAKLLDATGNPPANLFGVYEETWYIDTSVALIKQVLPQTKTIGTVYNQAEPQSRDALAALQSDCDHLGFNLIALPVNNSSETQLVMSSLLSKAIDVFFAPPDNTIFASFPIIVKACSEKHIPIFTSEAGLVKQGAVAAYGADMYQWGYQAGEQASQFLKQGNLDGLHPEIVKARKRVYNPEVAKEFNITFDSQFEVMK